MPRRWRGFAGIDLAVDTVPDETTILNFRHWLERHDLSRSLFDEVSAMLEERGLLMRQGTIVDATIIAAPSSTKNKQKKSRPGDAPDQEGQSMMEWMPLLTASRCAKVVMFSHPTNGESIHGKG